jgi:hypothetical protein
LTHVTAWLEPARLKEISDVRNVRCIAIHEAAKAWKSPRAAATIHALWALIGASGEVAERSIAPVLKAYFAAFRKRLKTQQMPCFIGISAPLGALA